MPFYPQPRIQDNLDTMLLRDLGHTARCYKNLASAFPSVTHVIQIGLNDGLRSKRFGALHVRQSLWTEGSL
jgi:hypothetical protein